MPSLKQEIKDLNRLREILVVLTEEGLGYYIGKSKLRSQLPFLKKIVPRLPVNDREQQALYLRKALERLGGTFIKLGQLLSVRPDLVPKTYSKELEKLQDNDPAFSYVEVKRIVEDELKQPIKKIFRTFDQKPIASASIAQVHKAVLKSGETVAVKVQRPDIREKMDADLDILFFIAQELEKYLPKVKSYQPLNVVKEFALWTRKELDFLIEADNAKRIRTSLRNNKQIRIPVVYSKWTTSRVLTMEYVKGVKLDNLAALSKNHVNLKTIASIYFKAILEQALINGVFHADPHPGNIFVGADKKLIFLDFGIVGELTLEDRHKVIQFILSIEEQNPEKSINIILSLAKEIKNNDLTLFKAETEKILRDVYEHSLGERSVGKALYEIIGLGAKYGVIFNPNQVLMAKALYQAEGLCLELAPQFKIAEGLQEFAETYLEQQLAPQKIIQRVKQTLVQQRNLLLDLPDHLVKIMKQLEEPQPAVHCEQEHFQELELKIEEEHHKENVALMAVIIILGSSFLFWKDGSQIEEVSFRWVLGGLLGILVLYLWIVHRRIKRFFSEKNGGKQ